MQSVSWQIEIARLAGGIQVRQGESDSVQLVGGYLAGVVSLIEPPQPSMAKRTDHELIILCAGTAINGFANLPHTDTDTWRLPTGALNGYARNMALSERQLLNALSRTPFVDSAELAGILGEPHATVHRTLNSLLAEGIVGRVNHGTTHLPSSQRYHLTARGVGETAGVLGFETPSDFVRAYPVSREWLTLLIRRMDAVAAVYRLAASLSPGIDGLRSSVGFDRRGRFDATITLHDGRSFGVVRQGLALRRRSLNDRLRAIAGYDYTRRHGTVLILVPSVWEERLTTRFCERLNLDDCFVAVESRDALERRDRRLWHKYSWVGSTYRTLEDVSAHDSPGGRRSTATPERKRASLPRPERMARAAPAFGISPSEKRTLDLVTDHPMVPREHLARWLGISEGRVSQMMRSLVDTWGLVEQRGKRGDTRYTLSAEGIRYVTHRDRAQLPTTQGIWGTQLSPPTNRAADGTWATASTRGRGRRSTPTASRGSSRSFRPRPGTTPTASWCGRSPPPGPTGPTTGEIPPSPRTPWGTCSPAVSTYRSTSSTSYAPGIPRESLPAWTPMRTTTGLPNIRRTSRHTPSLSSSWTPRRSRTPTCVPPPG